VSIEDIALLNPTVQSDMFYKELQVRLRAQQLRAVGISTMTAGCVEARHIARLVKAESKGETVVIIGGPHEDDVVEKTASHPEYAQFVDFSVTGDGEFSLQLLGHLLFEYQTASPEEFKAVVLDHRADFAKLPGKGSVVLRNRGEVQVLPLSNKPLDLNLLPRMPRELIHEADTRTFSVFRRGGWNVKTAQVMTQRGCEWRCNFCSESSALNMRSVDNVIAEIQEALRFSTKHDNRADYEAIFFDDSTFTTRSPRRRRFLTELFERIRGMQKVPEWGCQTRLDMIDREILREMERSGCTYVYTGLESASNEMLRAMGKDEDRLDIDSAFKILRETGVRVGLSLFFGATKTGSGRTAETAATIAETLDFVQEQTRHGNVVAVSPNLATYYPGTRLTNGLGEPLDFHNPNVLRAYPWNRFEEGESFHPSGLSEDMARQIIKGCIERFGEFVVDQDLYAIEDFQFAYRAGNLSAAKTAYLDFNHSSIAHPMSATEAAARAAQDSENELTPDGRRKCYEAARQTGARLLGLESLDSSNVVFGRNTTDVSALCLWIAGLHTLSRPRVLITTAENLSISRAFRLYMDHGNSRGTDLWSSFQDFGVTHPPHALPRRWLETEFDLIQADVLDKGLTDPEHEILSKLTKDTNLVVFSHVIRDHGRVLDVAALCKEIRQRSNARILVDGAQALGTVPSVRVAELGCDFYVAAPHKTLGCYPLGLLWVNDEMKSRLGTTSFAFQDGSAKAIILEGMFSPKLAIAPTADGWLSLPEVAGFTEAVAQLSRQGRVRGSDASELAGDLGECRRTFLSELREALPSAEVEQAPPGRQCASIASFRIPGEDNRAIVDHLWRDHCVFASYIARTDLVRFSFGLNNSPRDARAAARLVADVSDALRSSGRMSSSQSDKAKPVLFSIVN
jgi:selenocysteine lyase/cysteine desulfurase/radical SAM superfamily enzyme YgiQ (UPF0313 family)